MPKSNIITEPATAKITFKSYNCLRGTARSC